MDEIILRHIEAFGIGIAALGAVYFGWKQTQINKRMQELADYVAISIIPLKDFQIQIMNVGRINLYLHKWEAGSLNETFVKPLLIPIDAKSFIIISLQSPPMGQHLLKLYLTDEKKQKYLSTGEIAIEPIAFQVPTTTKPTVQQELPQTSGNEPVSVTTRMRAWSYQTEKYNWRI